MPSIKHFVLLLFAVSSEWVRLPEGVFYNSPFDFMDCILLPAALFIVIRKLVERLYYPLKFGIWIWFYQSSIGWQMLWERIYANRLRRELKNSRVELDDQKTLSSKYYKRVEENIDHWKSMAKTHNTLRKLYEDELQKLLSYRQEMLFLQGIDNRLHWNFYWWGLIPYKLECDPRHRLQLARRISTGLQRFCESRLERECEYLYQQLDVTQRRERLKTVMDELGMS